MSVRTNGRAGLLLSFLLLGLIISTRVYGMKVCSTENGLQYIFEARKDTGVAAAQIWVKVGSRHEDGAIAGITHFIEHLIFKGTDEVKANEMASRIEGLGGTINAFTSYDNTVYHIVMPSGAFEEGFQLLLDAVRAPAFPDAEVTKEKKVVLEEIKMGEDDPQRKLFKELFSVSFGGSPYGRPIIGFNETVAAVERDRIKSYYGTHYIPSNMVVTVVGDFDEEKAAAMIKASMTGTAAEIPGPADTAPGTGTTLEKTKIVRRELKESYLALSYSVPGLTHEDMPVLDVLETILGSGESSRLQEELKRRKGLVTNASAYLFAPKEAGLFIALATFKGEDYRGVVDGIQGEFVRLRETGPTEWEMEKAKNMIRSSYVYGAETVQGRARQVGNFQTLTGDPLFTEKYLARIGAVTADDIKAMLAKYLVGREPAGLAVLLPKKAGNSRNSTHRLKNGLSLVINRNQASPSFAFRIGFVGGTKQEPAEKNGIFNLLSRMLLKGTKEKDASAIAREIDMLAGDLSPFCGRNIFGLSGKFLSKDRKEVFRLLKELLTETALDEGELKRVKEEVLSEIRQKEDDPVSHTFMFFNELLYEGHPYAMDASGKEKTVRAITHSDLEKFYRDYVTPGSAVIAISGDVDEKELIGLFTDLFTDWKGKEIPLQRLPVTAPFKRAHVVEKDIRQAHLVFGFLGPGLVDKDRPSVEVMAAILAGMGGRIHKILREDNPYAYALTFFNQMAFEAGAMGVYIGTDPKLTKEVERILGAEFERIRKEGFTEEEVEKGKRFLSGNHYVKTQANSAIATAMCLDTMYGLGPRYFRAWPAEINKVTQADVNRVALEYLDRDRMIALAVGGTL